MKIIIALALLVLSGCCLRDDRAHTVTYRDGNGNYVFITRKEPKP